MSETKHRQGDISALEEYVLQLAVIMRIKPRHARGLNYSMS